MEANIIKRSSDQIVMDNWVGSLKMLCSVMSGKRRCKEDWFDSLFNFCSALITVHFQMHPLRLLGYEHRFTVTEALCSRGGAQKTFYCNKWPRLTAIRLRGTDFLKGSMFSSIICILPRYWSESQLANPIPLLCINTPTKLYTEPLSLAQQPNNRSSRPSLAPHSFTTILSDVLSFNPLAHSISVFFWVFVDLYARERKFLHICVQFTIICI